MAGSINTPTPPVGVGQPLWLLAELTYRCPLHCVFCYNPVDFARQEQELSTADWLRVLREGRAHCPVSLHGVGLSLGSAQGIDTAHLDQLARLVQAIDPVRVSDHASFARGAVVHAADLLPVPMSRAALDAWVERTVHVSALRFCTAAQLDTWIEALKAWQARGGPA